MANYNAVCRSGYFRVLDPEAFKVWCQKSSVNFWEEKPENPSEPMLYAIYTEDGGWPSSYWSEDDGDYVEFDLVEGLREHVAPEQSVILMEVGFEKLRYLVGQAIVLGPNGQQEFISLGALAAEKAAEFSPNFTEPEH